MGRNRKYCYHDYYCYRNCHYYYYCCYIEETRRHAIRTIILPRACSYKDDLIFVLILFIYIFSSALACPRKIIVSFARYETCYAGNVSLVYVNLCGMFCWSVFLLSGTSSYDGLVCNKIFLPLFLSTTPSILEVSSANNVI